MLLPRVSRILHELLGLACAGKQDALAGPHINRCPGVCIWIRQCFLYQRNVTSFLGRMIDAGEIFARIDSEKSMVRFLEEPEQFASVAMVDRLHECIRQSVTLSERVTAAEHAVRAALAHLKTIKSESVLALHSEICWSAVHPLLGECNAKIFLYKLVTEQ